MHQVAAIGLARALLLLADADEDDGDRLAVADAKRVSFAATATVVTIDWQDL